MVFGVHQSSLSKFGKAEVLSGNVGSQHFFQQSSAKHIFGMKRLNNRRALYRGHTSIFHRSKSDADRNAQSERSIYSRSVGEGEK